MSLRLGALDLWLRLVEKPRLARARSVPAARARLERLVALMGEGVAADEVRLGGGPALRIPAPAGAGILLWLHGGAYCLGSPRTHVALVAALARRAGIGAVLPGYRRAPEHPFPAAVEDSRAAWAALRAEGWPAARIALGGDSAGGGLVFALLHGLLADGEPPPSCVVAFSPWADLTLAGASLAALARRDAFLPAASARRGPRPLPRRGRPGRPARLAASRPLPRRAAGADPGQPLRDPARRRPDDGGAARRGRRGGDARPLERDAACLAVLPRPAAGGRHGARPRRGLPRSPPATQNGVIAWPRRNIRARRPVPSGSCSRWGDGPCRADARS